MKTVLIGLVTFVICYFMAAFVAWQANPGLWPEKLRAFVAIVGSICTIPAMAGTHALLTSKQQQ